MESSKSGVKNNTPDDTEEQIEDEALFNIFEPNVEGEVQNILMTGEISTENQACDSTRKDLTKRNIDTSTKSEPITNSVEAADTQNENTTEQTVNVTEAVESQTHETLNVQDHTCNISHPVTNRGATPNTFGTTIAPPTRPHPLDTYRTLFLENPNTAGSRGAPLLGFSRPAAACAVHRGPPPSYSKSILDPRVNPCASIQFVAPIPPPSYDGTDSVLRYMGHPGFTLGLGNTWQSQPQPAYCPVCETVIITQVDVRISTTAHIIAFFLFLILCWPFCLIPYFLNVCNFTAHYCSVCHRYLGARRPFQRT